LTAGHYQTAWIFICQVQTGLQGQGSVT